MKHGSLFSGIGGFDLAAEWMGWENVFHCEFNPFCQRILKHYWPDAKSYGDIKETDFSEWRGRVDIISGGFPCQPYSQAGKRKGKDDDRHLWPEMLRAIREIQPCFVVGENVYGLLNWSGGLVFEEVQTDLENEGYEVTSFILPACAVNAPHRRDRIWFIAHSNKIGINNLFGAQDCNHEGKQPKNYEQAGSGWPGEIERHVKSGVTTDTQSIGRQCGASNRNKEREAFESEQGRNYEVRGESIGHSRIITNTERIGQSGSERTKGSFYSKTDGNWKASWSDPNGKWPTVSPIRGRDDGLSSKLVKQCLEGLGNAVVPQVVFEIFKAIESIEI